MNKLIHVTIEGRVLDNFKVNNNNNINNNNVNNLK